MDTYDYAVRNFSSRSAWMTLPHSQRTAGSEAKGRCSFSLACGEIFAKRQETHALTTHTVVPGMALEFVRRDGDSGHAQSFRRTHGSYRAVIAYLRRCFSQGTSVVAERARPFPALGLT